MKNDYYVLKVFLPGVIGALIVSLFIFLARSEANKNHEEEIVNER